MAVGTVSFFVFSAPDVVKIPFEIPQHDQIKESIAIQINPCSACRPATASDGGFLRHIGESAIAIVVIKLVPAVRSNVQILIAVIVVIPYGYSHAVARSLQTGLLGNVFERAVCLLVIQPIPILPPPSFRADIFWRCATPGTGNLSRSVL